MRRRAAAIVLGLAVAVVGSATTLTVVRLAGNESAPAVSGTPSPTSDPTPASPAPPRPATRIAAIDRDANDEVVLWSASGDRIRTLAEPNGWARSDLVYSPAEDRLYWTERDGGQDERVRVRAASLTGERIPLPFRADATPVVSPSGFRMAYTEPAEGSFACEHGEYCPHPSRVVVRDVRTGRARSWEPSWVESTYPFPRWDGGTPLAWIDERRILLGVNAGDPGSNYFVLDRRTRGPWLARARAVEPDNYLNQTWFTPGGAEGGIVYGVHRIAHDPGPSTVVGFDPMDATLALRFERSDVSVGSVSVDAAGRVLVSASAVELDGSFTGEHGLYLVTGFARMRPIVAGFRGSGIWIP